MLQEHWYARKLGCLYVHNAANPHGYNNKLDCFSNRSRSRSDVRMTCCLIMDQGCALTLSLLRPTQEAIVDSVDQDQTAQNMQFDLRSTLSTLFIHDLTVSSPFTGSVFLAN